MHPKVIQSDSSFVHEQSLGSHDIKMLPGGAAKEATTIFGQQFLAIAIDEAHGFHNTNRFYTAIHALRKKTDILVPMTATPVQSRPMVRSCFDFFGCRLSVRYIQDLWNIGRAVRIHGFKNEDTIDTELKQMASEMAKVKWDDRKLTPDLEAQLHGFLQRLIQGTPDAHSVGMTQHRVDINFQVANAKWMKIVHAKYEGAVIRQGIDSVDNKGKPISGLDPYLESVCMLKLYDHEYIALEQLAENTLDKKLVARRFSSEVSRKRHVQMELCTNVPQNFYLQI